MMELMVLPDLVNSVGKAYNLLFCSGSTRSLTDTTYKYYSSKKERMSIGDLFCIHEMTESVARMRS